MKPKIKLKLPAVSAGTVPDSAHRGASLIDDDVVTWRPRSSSADGELIRELPQIVMRSRDMDRNNGIARGAIQTRIDNVVGTGLRLSARPDFLTLGRDRNWGRQWARKTQSLFCAWFWTTACHAGGTMTGDQMTAQIARTEDMSGEFLALPLWLPEVGDGFATKIQTVDPDRLSQPSTSTESARFHGGIEFDRYGRPLAYHIKRTHPRDTYATVDPASFGWERIERYTAFGRLKVIHGFDPERPGQSRGRPALASVLPQFKQIDRMTNAEISKAIVQSMHAMVVKTPLSGEEVVDLFRDQENGAQKYLDARLKHAVALKNGTVTSLFPGDDVEAFLATSPTSTFAAFFEVIARILGVGLDLPYELLMKDFSKTNYSSARAALLEAWRSFNRQREWLGTQWMDPLYKLFLEEMVNAGRIDAPGFYENAYAYCACKWIGPGRGWIDPVKEAEAAAIRIVNGLSTLEEECAQQGLYWEEVLEQLAIEMEYRKELGLPPVTAPAKSTTPYPSDVEQNQQKPKEAVPA